MLKACRLANADPKLVQFACKPARGPPDHYSPKKLSLRMIKSMTGYGIASFDSGNTKYTVEIKSLNSKFLELSLRIPKSFSEKEFQLRNECNKQIERGKVSLSINVEQG